MTDSDEEYLIGEEYYLYSNGELLAEATYVDDKYNGQCFLAVPPPEKKSNPRAVWVIWETDIDFAILKKRGIK